MLAVKKTYRNIIWILCMICLFAGSTVCAKENTVTAFIPVSCIGKETSEHFTYNLEYSNSVHQKIKSHTLSLKNGQTGKFQITFDCPGKYQFKVSQKAGSDSKTTYDKTVYNVDIYVVQEDDKTMQSVVVAYKSGKDEKTDKVEFVNKKKTKSKKKSGTAGASRNKTKDGSGTGAGSEEDGSVSGASRNSDTLTGKPAGETKTGDSSPVYEYIMVCALSMLFFILTLIRIRKSFTS